MVFGYGKVDPKKSVIVNTRTDNYHILLKKWCFKASFFYVSIKYVEYQLKNTLVE